VDLGTPIINSVDDLYPQIRFLHFTGGLSDHNIFTRLITRPLKAGDQAAAGRLQLLMSSTTLRRRKDMKFDGKFIVNLPGVTEYIHKIGNSPHINQNSGDVC
jgi:SWI/SNF-related matrix-associated actin-dependent regulator of chromatin subfamily A3